MKSQKNKQILKNLKIKKKSDLFALNGTMNMSSVQASLFVFFSWRNISNKSNLRFSTCILSSCLICRFLLSCFFISSYSFLICFLLNLFLWWPCEFVFFFSMFPHAFWMVTSSTFIYDSWFYIFSILNIFNFNI